MSSTLRWDGRSGATPSGPSPSRSATATAPRRSCCEGFVTEEFGRLAQSAELTTEQQQRFAAMKQALADQLMATDAADEFDRDQPET